MWQYDPVRQKNTLRSEFNGAADDQDSKRGQHDRHQAPQARDQLLFHKNFDIKHNNELAANQLRLQFNTSPQVIVQFAQRAHYFVLRH